MQVSWKGVYPAVTTKFKADGSLDIPGFLHNIQAQLDAGVDGIIIGGSLGESSTITHEERLELLRAALDQTSGAIPVILNIAEGATQTAVRLAKMASGAGAHGLMLLPPMMYRTTPSETVRFFTTVAAGTDLPILLYNNPVDYKTEITVPMFEAFLGHENIQAVKESTRDISNVTRMRSAYGDRFKILCGVDTLAMEELLMGADGWVAGLVNAFPAETVAVYRLTKSGQTEAALAIYSWFLPLLELDISPQLVQNIKLAEAMTGLGNEYVRPPRVPLEGVERARVMALLEKHLANRPILPDYLNIKIQD